MQAYVNIHWRFYYYVEGDAYVIYNLKAHPQDNPARSVEPGSP